MISRLHRWLPLAVVWALILAYGLFFSAFSIQRHRALLTHASDLGQIDQAIWTTLHGHLLEHTKATGVQNIRLSDHVEPVFIPLSLLFLIYDNVEALLVAQSFIIALGALAVFWIARKQFASIFATGAVQTGAWVAVGFAALYLLFPALEAANLAEFHAVTLAPAPLLFAYYYGTERAWGRFAFFSILALAVQESIPPLVFMMAAWFAVKTEDDGRMTVGHLIRALRHPSSVLRRRQPLFIALLSIAWFVVALFVIIPHFNALGRSPYTCRYGVGEDCPQVAHGLFLPERLGYIGQLLASAGWIALLDPLPLLLGLPLIAANALSNFPATYSGSFHYSAPVAPYFVLAAIGGTARLVQILMSKFEFHPPWRFRRVAAGQRFSIFDFRFSNYEFRIPSFPPFPILVIAAVLLLAFGYHLVAGYTPVGGAFLWPAITPHDELLARFTAQIPADAVVSTTGALNPHLSHRRVLYRYPIVNDAQYVLLDVGESTNANPIDFRVAYNDLVDNGSFGVVDAADGYVLLKRSAVPKPLPEALFSIFRANGHVPQYPLIIDFGDAVRFLGYDVVSDQYGRGSLRMYWQKLKPLDKNYNLFLFYPDDRGAPRADVTLPSTLLFWYPTSMWQLNETVSGQTVPLDLGPRARVGLAVLDGDNWGDLSIRLPARTVQPGALHTFDDSTWVELGVLKKSGNVYLVDRAAGD